MQTKKCTKCGIEKNISEFTKHPYGKLGVQPSCKNCVREYQNSDVYKKYQKEYRKTDAYKKYRNSKACKKSINKYRLSDTCKKSQEKYRNSDVWREYKKTDVAKKAKKKSQEKYLNTDAGKNYTMKRYYSDLNFKLKMNLRNRFSCALKRNYKHGSAVKMLGCSIEEFKTYFQSLFTEGMNWEKVFDGSIHIDHKKPLASFDLSIPENQTKACHYTNLQPLWAVDNLRKSDKWED